VSGGSFNYLCDKRGGDLRAAVADVRAMRDELVAFDTVPGLAAALRTFDDLLRMIDRDDPMDAAAERLRGVMKAVEWWRSSDWSAESVREALAEFGALSAAPAETSVRDLIERLRELVEPAIRAADASGEAQAVDVTSVFAGDDPEAEHLAVVQRAIDAVVCGSTMTGYAACYPDGRGGIRLAAVIRGPG